MPRSFVSDLHSGLGHLILVSLICVILCTHILCTSQAYYTHSFTHSVCLSLYDFPHPLSLSLAFLFILKMVLLENLR